MPTAGALADILLRRVRDPGGTAHNRLLVLRVLSEAQRLVNAETRAVFGEAEFVVGQGCERNLYDSKILNLQELLPFAIRVEALRDDVRDIPRVEWRTIAQADRFWLRRLGGTIECWAHFSPARLILYPGPDQPAVLRAVYTLRTGELAETTEMELPVPLHGAILDLAEQILLVRQRLYATMAPTAGRLEHDLGATSR